MRPNYHNFKPEGMIMDPDRYDKYIGSKQWKRIRQAVIKRDKGVCQCCLRTIATNHRITAHHTSYDRLYHEEMSDLTTVCTKCHLEIHSLYPVPRYKMYDGRLLKIALPNKALVERERAKLRHYKIVGTVPKDADTYADKIMGEIANIERFVNQALDKLC